MDIIIVYICNFCNFNFTIVYVVTCLLEAKIIDAVFPQGVPFGQSYKGGLHFTNAQVLRKWNVVEVDVFGIWWNVIYIDEIILNLFNLKDLIGNVVFGIVEVL